MAVDYRRSGGHGHGAVGRPMDGGDPRTPMAWQHRDINFAYNDNNRYSSERETRDSRDSRQNGRHTGPNTPSTSSRMGKSAERRREHSEHRGSSSERYSGRGRGVSRDREHSSGRRGTHRSYNRSQPSPSSTDGTTEETTETDSQPPERERHEERSDYNGPTMAGYPVMVGYPMVAHPGYQGGYPGNMMISGAGSIRSVQSVPMLAPPAHTWDGEPCPVHHQHSHHHQQAMPLAALYGMGVPGIGYTSPMSIAPSSVPASVISAATVRRARSVAEVSTGYLTPGTPYSQMSHPGTPGGGHGTVDERRSLHASMGSIPAGAAMAHQLMPPMMRPPRVVVGENGTPSQLPQREPKKHSPLPAKDNAKKNKGMSCCSGNFVVIWIILGIITFGILLGIVLKFTVS